MNENSNTIIQATNKGTSPNRNPHKPKKVNKSKQTQTQ